MKIRRRAASAGRSARHADWRYRSVWVWCVILGAIAAMCAWVHHAVYQWQARDEVALVASRLDGLVAGLNMELARYETLPEIIALDSRLVQGLISPADARIVGAVTNYLQISRQRSGADVIYLMDVNGNTLASSNSATPESFVGKNYGFRPYVKEALKGARGRYYAIGVTSGKAGYFLAAPVRHGADIVGVLAVKASLDIFEAALAAGDGETVLVDAAGVTLLASEPALRYRTLRPLQPSQREEIEAQQQFNRMTLSPLVGHFDLEAGSPSAINALDPLVTRFDLLIARPVGPMGWRLATFFRTSASRRMANLAAAVCALACFGLGLAYLILKARRERKGELLRREEEIHLRIARATRHLKEQLEEQERIEATLRATTDTSVQAGKLAVLGQMAAAISHELNQPLTAMRGFAANTLLLIEQGRTELVLRNIGRMDQLAEKMGQMVGQLRSHVRKQPGPVVPVVLAEVFESTRELLQTLTKCESDVVFADCQGDLRVLAQRTRLEQVMVNLLRNAIEATPCSQPPCVSAHARGPFVFVSIRDYGPGLSEEAKSRMFEPFFTTKAPGHGLGLGLALSHMIVRELGGELTGGNAEGGGAVFQIRLLGILQERVLDGQPHGC